MKRSLRNSASIALLFVFGLPTFANDEAIQSTPLIPASPDESETLFSLIPPADSKLNFEHYWDHSTVHESAFDRAVAGGGVTIGDVDGDGLPDIYLSRPFGGGRLYRNLGDFRFADMTAAAGLGSDSGWGTGVSFVDVDNDRDLDLFVCGFATPNRIYINDGHGRFEDRATTLGLDVQGASIMMSFADYDRDGDLDGFLVRNRYEYDDDGSPLELSEVAVQLERDAATGRIRVAEPFRERFMTITRPDTGKPVLVMAGQDNLLFRNDGEAGFVEAAKAAGFRGNGQSLAATWWDHNRDGWPDLYVANDFYAPDHLYENQQDGTFTDVAPFLLPHTPWYSMGCDTGDINNDGWPDFIATDMAGTTHFKSKMGMGDMDREAWFLESGRPRQYMRNAVYLNSGADRFMEVAHQTNLDASDWTWSPKFGDFDCDGRLDLFITNGMTGDWFNSDLRSGGMDDPKNLEAMKATPKNDANMAFRNLGGLHFESVGEAWGLAEENVSFGAATADLDGDGDLDIVVNRFGGSALLYRNNLQSGSRLIVTLRGNASNSHGIGAHLTVETNGQIFSRYHSLARGVMSTNSMDIHFGLGEAKTIESLAILWPSGQHQVFHNLAVNRHYVITEGATASLPPSDRDRDVSPFVKFQRPSGKLRHREDDFDDFQFQPLLPNQLSRLGPGLAVVDLDRDGVDDLFLGGASGQPGQFASFDDNGRLAPRDDDQFLQAHRDREDMGALFFDAEGDGDKDLYVVSGGYGNDTNGTLLEDRLYVNHKGKFLFAEEALPDGFHSSGSCIAAGDYDRDGDLDLFVGGRFVPRAYPTTPSSRLLRNDSTTNRISFTDITQDVPGLDQVGMVTSAIWSDTDRNGDLDLLMTTEWGPVHLFKNSNGLLRDSTEHANLAERLGWWNGIAGSDVDHDGDIDFVVTNFGNNTKYHPDPSHPYRIYYSDFDSNGKFDIVEAKSGGSTELPIRGFSCSCNAIPGLRKDFKTFQSFASASLADIYSTEELKRSLQLQVNMLESGLLLNDGAGRFTFRPLPALAQVSPGFGVVFFNANGDAHPDICIAQNFYSPQRETGRMHGGVGAILLGDGTGNFRAVWPDSSGFVVPGDAKALALIQNPTSNGLDLLVSQNNGNLLRFATAPVASFSIRLVGRHPSNGDAIGARITLEHEDGTQQTSEVYAGGSYLGQSSTTVEFGSSHSRPSIVSVLWPDGSQSRHKVRTTDHSIDIRQPTTP